MTDVRICDGEVTKRTLMINSIAKVVGEVIEENNRRLLEELTGDSKKEVNKL